MELSGHHFTVFVHEEDKSVLRAGDSECKASGTLEKASNHTRMLRKHTNVE